MLTEVNILATACITQALNRDKRGREQNEVHLGHRPVFCRQLQMLSVFLSFSSLLSYYRTCNKFNKVKVKGGKVQITGRGTGRKEECLRTPLCSFLHSLANVKFLLGNLQCVTY